MIDTVTCIIPCFLYKSQCYMMHNKPNDYQYSGMLSVLYHTIKFHFSCVLLYPLHMKDIDQIYKPQKDFVVHYLLLFRLNCVL